MEFESAIQLIIKGVENNEREQVWIDLGAGNGLFSQALSEILPVSSVIYAVDKNYKAKQEIQSRKAGNQIVVIKKDFTKLLDLPACDGLLMANSLHYVEDKIAFLQQVRSLLKPGGRIIIVEYDTDQANQWVPWPVSCKNLQKIITENRLGSMQKLATENSMYQSGGIYSALILE